MFVIRADTEPLRKALRGFEKQIPFIVASALTATAKQAQTRVIVALPQTFDRPTPYTLNSTRVTPATKTSQVAEVGFRDFGGTPAKKYLLPHVHGGPRSDKRSERALKHIGHLPWGLQTAPGAAAEIDQFGNMKRGQTVKILSALRASRDPTQNQNLKARRQRGKRKNEQYFVSFRFGKGGVYKREPGRIRPVLAFIRQASYRPRFDFFGIIEAEVKASLQFNLQRSMRLALK